MTPRLKVSNVLGIVVTFLAATSIHARTFFVDAASGDDANSGRPNAPFATVQRGVDAAAERAGSDKVVVRAGTYTENIAIDDADALTLSGSGAEIVAAVDAEPAIAISSGDVSIRRLSITGGDPGIQAEPGADKSLSLTLTDVDASGNNGRGVNAEKADFVRVVGGTYNGNDGDGIKVEKTDTVHIEGADVTGNDSDGLDLEENGSMSLIRLIVNDNGDEGVEVDDCESVLVQGCESSNNADDGLDIDNTARAVIANCVATGNGDFEEENGNGLQVEADDADFPVDSVVVVNSIFSGNSQNGIHAVEDGEVVGLVALRLITAEDNQLSGVRIDTTGVVRFSQILSSGNGEPDVLP